MEEQHLEQFQGDYEPWLLTVVDGDGELVNLNNCQLKFTLKSSKTLPYASAQIKKSSENETEIEILDQGTYKGKARLYIKEEDTKVLTPKIYYFDVKLIDTDGEPHTTAYGTYKIKRPITDG